MNEVATPPTAQLLPDAEVLRRHLHQRRRLPISTYRFQLHRGFSFRDAAAVVPYLAQLGITDCYCSPYLAARPGSTHGYDITDHNTFNPEVGTEADYNAFAAALAQHDMGQVLDFVPNHMGVDPVTNHWWREVLEDGPSSPHARFFDIDWDPIKPELKGKVLLPFLGDHYGLVLERGELKVDFAGGNFIIRYFQTHLPVDPARLPPVLRHGLDALRAELGETDNDLLEFLSIITALEHLPRSRETNPERVAERQREKKVTRDRLARLTAGSPASASTSTPFSPPTTADQATAPASTPCTSCSTPSPIAWRTGKRPFTKSTIAAFSTSTSWPACGWKTRRCSRRRTP